MSGFFQQARSGANASPGGVGGGQGGPQGGCSHLHPGRLEGVPRPEGGGGGGAGPEGHAGTEGGGSHQVPQHGAGQVSKVIETFQN